MGRALGARAPSAALVTTVIVPQISNGLRQLTEGAQCQEYRLGVGPFWLRFHNPLVFIAFVLRIHDSALSPAATRTTGLQTFCSANT